MRVVVATGNRGKLAELQALLAPDGELIPQAQLGVQSVAETGATFMENALRKARHACAQTGLAAIADDSGLEVDALGGAPGIYSARYAGADATDADNIAKLLRELAAHDGDERCAQFCCALVWMRDEHDDHPLTATGVWRGRIATVAAGENGFGYDSIFFVDDYQQTAAQLDTVTKNRISHRAQALRQLKTQLTTSR